MDTEFQFGVMEKSWRWVALMVTQSVNVLNARELYI